MTSSDLAVPLTDAHGVTAERVGPKAATLAQLKRAGLPVPDGVCLTADVYRHHLERAGMTDAARQIASLDPFQARRVGVRIKVALTTVALADDVARTIEAARTHLVRDAQLAVRSSALSENTAPASFAGQFETFLGISEAEDLTTAVRACWMSVWSTRALRYMRAYDIDPATSAMSVLMQRMVAADASGGAFSLTPDDQIVLTGTWGLGTAIAQGDVVPDRYVLRRDASVELVEPGRKDHLVTAAATGTRSRAVSRERAEAPCLAENEATTLGQLVLAAESALGAPVEIEWAKDAHGFWIVQARPLHLEQRAEVDEVWRHHPAMTGQPAGIGWGTGRACIVSEERDLDRVPVGSIIVTEVGGPALSAVLPRAAGVIAELGGSTSHLAALARERGIPAVLGVRGATRRIPEGAMVAVDGITGIVRWMR